ncbi:MAG: hypothetical protein U9P38_04475, partial [Campylobacterota bacterium]|nr:hypothetical protein [Campylobacterota bacterium]
MARKRKKERKVVSKPKIKEERKNKNYLLWSLIILPIVLFIFGTGYYLGYQSALNQSKVTTIEKIEEEEEEKTPNQTILDTKKRLELLQDIELVEVVETTAVIKQKRIETV